jgi:IS30 family transposase
LELLPIPERPTPRIRQRLKKRMQDQTRLEAEKASELIQLYQAGETVYELSEQFNVHRQTVSSILKRNNVKLRRTGLRETEICQAIELYKSGLSMASVGARLGKPGSTICRALTAQGIPTRDSHGRPRN